MLEDQTYVEVAEVLMIKLLRGDNSEKTLAFIKAQGISIDKELDLEVPKLPRDITELDDEDLIRLFQHLNEFTKFIKVQVACAQIDESDAKKRMDYLEASFTTQYTVPKATVASIKAKVMSEDSMKVSVEEYQAKHDYRKMIEMMVSNLESDMHLVSRELTRRTSSSSFKTRGSRFTI
jgi:hypothetical protein